MIRLAVLLLLTACAQSDTLVDAGQICVDTTPSDPSQNDPGLVVGEPIPLFMSVSGGCSTSFSDAECMVEILGREALISTAVTLNTPGRAPWQGQNDCAKFVRLPCEMPPAYEGVTTVVYGDNRMDLRVPGDAEGCISSVARP